MGTDLLARAGVPEPRPIDWKSSRGSPDEVEVGHHTWPKCHIFGATSGGGGIEMCSLNVFRMKGGAGSPVAGKSLVELY